MLKKIKRFFAIISAAVITAAAMAISVPTAASASESAEYTDLVRAVSVLVNEARAEAGLEPLYLVPYISQVAQFRSSECVDIFSHTRPNGLKFSTAVDYSKLPYMKISENIAAGNETAEATFEQWKNSPAHWAAIMNPSYTHIGIGVTYDPDSYYQWYWTQLFVRIDGELDGQELVTRESLAPVMKRTASSEAVHTVSGDINGDGAINSFDCITLSKYVFGSIELNDIQIESADVMKDGEINLADIVTLRKYIIGSYNSLPVIPEM